MSRHLTPSHLGTGEGEPTCLEPGGKLQSPIAPFLGSEQRTMQSPSARAAAFSIARSKAGDQQLPATAGIPDIRIHAVDSSIWLSCVKPWLSSSNRITCCRERLVDTSHDDQDEYRSTSTRLACETRRFAPEEHQIAMASFQEPFQNPRPPGLF